MKIPHVPDNPLLIGLGVLRDRTRKIDLRSLDILPGGRYRHWEKLRFLTPPDGLTAVEWWSLIKLARAPSLKPIPLQDAQGNPFVFSTPDPALAMLSRIDRELAGTITTDERIMNPSLRDRYLLSSLIDEAITSSQLEGAATTRLVAEELLRSRRAPRDRSEQMIANNFQAMQRIREIRDQPLTVARLFELQRILTDNTLDDRSAAGRLRRPDEYVVVADQRDGSVLHTPPPAGSLPQRLEALCAFASTDDPHQYLHPAVKAAIVHFWLAYDHPFVDGNGRTARALFYWSMLRAGYWITEFLSISSIVAKARGRYRRAYLYSETDDNDLTYFVLWHLSVVVSAIDRLSADMRQKQQQIVDVESRLKRTRDFNHRQLALLAHALRHPSATYTAQIHATSHGVALQTARNDLDRLVAKRLLRRVQQAKKFAYLPTPSLAQKFG